MSKARAKDQEAEDQRTTAGRLENKIMHEIRNPLEPLGHLFYLAELDADNPNGVLNYMQIAEEQLRSLGRITSQTLSFAKLSQERNPI